MQLKFKYQNKIGNFQLDNIILVYVQTSVLRVVYNDISPFLLCLYDCMRAFVRTCAYACRFLFSHNVLT
jgi:hypothetical protein